MNKPQSFEVPAEIGEAFMRGEVVGECLARRQDHGTIIVLMMVNRKALATEALGLALAEQQCSDLELLAVAAMRAKGAQSQ